jgi:hypothetical protein
VAVYNYFVLGRGSWVVGRGSWVAGRGSWVVGRGSWVVGRGSWVVGGRGGNTSIPCAYRCPEQDWPIAAL